MKFHEKGFSLLELLVVVAIIGMLVAMAIPLLLDALDRSKQRADIAEMRIWGTALSAYYSEKSVFPGAPGGPVNASSIHSDLVPYAVSQLHDNNDWQWPFQYYTDVTASYTVQDMGKDGFPPSDLSQCPIGCVTPLTWQNYDFDMALIDGIFVWAPS